MENVILIIHLILALCLIGIVLLQRSEGGGLGIGGGGGGSVMSGRQAATALAKLTWVFAAAFFATSLALTVIAARNASTGSVMDQTTSGSTGQTGPAPVSNSKLPAAKDLLPPSPSTSGSTTGGTSGGTDSTAPAAPTAPPRAGN
jgi:preprotein translocase subunit SecG